MELLDDCLDDVDSFLEECLLRELFRVELFFWLPWEFLKGAGVAAPDRARLDALCTWQCCINRSLRFVLNLISLFSDFRSSLDISLSR